MKLGNDRIGARTSTPRVDADGHPVRDEFGDQLVDVVDRIVRWCQVSPTGRTSDTTEPSNRQAPAMSGRTVLAPPDSGIDLNTVVIWPITSETGEGPTLQLSGRLWQVVGEPHPWEEALEVNLRAAT